MAEAAASEQSDPETTPFVGDSNPPVRGFLHRPAAPSGDALVLTHGASSNSQALLLLAMANAFAEAGWTVLRCDLPYRQKRPHGPPYRGDAIEDRKGLRNAVEALRKFEPGHAERIFLGGHSYGGRQATMLVAEDFGPAGDAPGGACVDGLILFSYPLHPPGKPDQLRTAHLPSLYPPALFVHGSKDPFGSLEEMRAALKLIPGRTSLLPVEGVGHDLGFGRRGAGARNNLATEIVTAFSALVTG